MAKFKSARIPNNLRKRRIQAGFKQYEVAEKLGRVSSTLVGNWENGLSMPTVEQLIKLSALYSVLMNDLYSELYLKLKREFYPPDAS